MSEVRSLLERAQSRFPAPDRVMDRLMDRRDRKRRSRRIVSAVVALALAGAALGGLLETFRGAGERRPGSNQSSITPQTAGDLRTAWVGLTPHTIGSDQGIALPPVVEGNRVYVDSNGFFVYAFSTTCASGGRLCEPEWISGGTGHRAGGTPATSGIGGRVVWPATATNDHLYQSAVDQAVLAYPASCGTQAATCAPLWEGDFKGVPSSPVIAADVVYVFAGGTVYAFPAACDSGARSCPPLWTGATPQQGTHQPSHLAVADGILYVTAGRSVYAFSTTCDHAQCAPIWHAESPGSGGVEPSVPVPGGGAVFVADSSQSGSRLTAYPTSCHGSCQPLWSWFRRDGSHLSSDPVFAGASVYVTEGPSQGRTLLLAFKAACRTDGGVCAPEWVGSGLGEPVAAGGRIYVNGGTALGSVLAYGVRCGTEGSVCTPAHAYQGGAGQPVLSGGVLYVGSGHSVLAYDPGCTDTSCRPIWSGTIHGVVRSGPVVTDDAVYVGTSEGEVVAFRLTGGPNGVSGTATAVAGLLLLVALGLGAIVVRRRRL
jgi:hypothetical protein